MWLYKTAFSPNLLENEVLNIRCYRTYIGNNYGTCKNMYDVLHIECVTFNFKLTYVILETVHNADYYLHDYNDRSRTLIHYQL